MSADPPRFRREVENLVASFRRLPGDPGRSRPRAAKPLSELIEQLRLRYQIGRESLEQALRDRWPELVGAANAAYSHAARLEHGRLHVLATHAVVRQELSLHREAILERVRRVPGCAGVREIRIRAG